MLAFSQTSIGFLSLKDHFKNVAGRLISASYHFFVVAFLYKPFLQIIRASIKIFDMQTNSLKY